MKKLSIVLSLMLWLTGACAQAAGPGKQVPVESRSAAGGPVSPERDMAGWLARLHEASRGRAYQGTFVVSSGAGALSSARIWHVCDGQQQMERVDVLTGTPRVTLRRDDQVLTFLPGSKAVRSERLELPGLFPDFLKNADGTIAAFYRAHQVGSGRVAGLDADVVEFLPRDGQRFGYRLWSEKKTGLVVKVQTLDVTGQVLEQAAFSELQLDAPVRMEQLAQMMDNTSGYRVQTLALSRTTAAAEGWQLSPTVPGFQPMSCFRRDAPQGAADSSATLQCIFSDGLASVSLFVEADDPRRHRREGVARLGATQTLVRRLTDGQGAQWWLTVVGEVPIQTLLAITKGLERKP